ncbi:sensor histidine kinase [Phenylobacterium sp.]|uniref:sensor histidine kinase n=1 Tax=Phenylobacterium sp. TaxID=1871053 RepID=UPI002F9449D7
MSADATVGRRVTEAIPGIGNDTIETYGRVVDSGQPASFEIEVSALGHRSYEARAHSLGCDRFAVLFLEITERKRIEKALAESRAMLSDIVGTVDQIVWSALPDGRHDFFNSRWYEFTGARAGSNEEATWASLRHPDDREQVSERWLRSLATGEPYEIEYRLLHHSGQYRWILGRAHPVRNAAGEIIRWMGTFTDIDAAKRAEAELRESEEQFRTMAEALPQLVWMADDQGRIYWYNRRWYEYTGAAPQEAEGWGWRKAVHPEHAARVAEGVQLSAETGEPWEDTFPLRGADGEYRWFLSRATPLHDARGRITRWFGASTDITEKQKLEEFQALLIREISHRVKNSLALVSALLDLQARSLEGGLRAALDDAASRVGAVATVHDQLFRQATTREIDLKPFLSNLAVAIATSAPEHETVIDVEPAIVPADIAVPIGLFVNELITNAYKYAYPEGDEGEVRITGERTDEEHYRLAVSDLGVGLPKGFDLARAYESLGMRIITTLAKQLGGELTADSTEPGARFALVFPVRPAPPLAA